MADFQMAHVIERAPIRTAPPPPVLPTAKKLSGDGIFRGILIVSSLLVLAIVGLLLIELWRGSALARHTFGWEFVTSSAWDPVLGDYGAAPFIFGTLITSGVALLIATPIGVGAAVYMAHLAPKWLSRLIEFLIDMLAAIPSVIFGLWALFALVPLMRTSIQPWLNHWFGFLPLFQGAPYGVGLLTASLVLTIMILPTITSISRAVLVQTPEEQMLGAYGLGATRWEVIRHVALPHARNGIVGAVILGLGRALGETMAVTMVIGNRGGITNSLFALGDTMASVIANQFAEAADNLLTSALIEIGLILFIVTILLNVGARLLVARIGGSSRSAW